MNAEELEDDDGRPIKTGSILQSPKTKYLVQALLGAGGFGAVFRVSDLLTNEEYAMKIEKKIGRRKHSKLKMEVAILKMVANARGENSHYVSIIDRAKKDKIFFLVMSLVGPSLEDIKKQYKHKIFSMGTALGVATQCLEAVEDLHNNGFIHRDLKPANYACGLGEKTRIVYILDFGIARKFTKDDDNHVKAPRTYVGFKGTIRFACLACHNNKELYPKDDVESWFYMLIDMSMPQGLVWRRYTDREKVRKAKEIARLNNLEEMLGDALCKDEYQSILKYIDGLQFGDKVDYEFIYQTLKLAAQICKVDINDPYDWEKSKEKEAEQAS